MDYNNETLHKLVNSLLAMFQEEVTRSKDLNAIYGSLGELLQQPAEQIDAIQELCIADGRLEMMQKTLNTMKHELGI